MAIRLTRGGSGTGAAPAAGKKKVNDYGTGIPYHEVESPARVLLPEIQTFFESEEGQRELAEWKKQREAEQLKRAKHKTGAFSTMSPPCVLTFYIRIIVNYVSMINSVFYISHFKEKHGYKSHRNS